MKYHIVCRLKHNGVFELITRHELYSVIHNSLEELMLLSPEQTLTLLLEKRGGGGGLSVPTDIVVSRLSNNKYLLYKVSNFPFYSTTITSVHSYWMNLKIF